MIKDRLAELHAAQNSNRRNGRASLDDEYVVTITPSSNGTDAVVAHHHLSVNDLTPFHREVEDINTAIEYISSNVNEVSRIHSTILSTPKTDEKTKLKLEDLMAEIKRTAMKVRARLKGMEQDLDSKFDSEARKSSAEYRIKKTQHSMLEHKVVQVMTEYNRIQNDYRDKCKNRIQRQLEITGRQTTTDEVEEMLEKDNPAIFTQGIVTDTQEARQILADVEERHEDIIKLEKSIRELHDLFVDMATLIEQQGDTIDRIENHVQSSKQYVEVARTNMTKAVVYQSKARKKKIILYSILVVIIVVIIISVVVGVSQK